MVPNEIESKNRKEIIVESRLQLQKLSAQLERSNKDLQRFASIIETSDDAIITKDLKGVIVSWNKAAEITFGYKAEEVIGKLVSILIPKDRKNEEPAILQRIVQGERIDHYDTVRQRKDGSLVDISLTISPIRDNDGIIGASKIARDITERKRIERELHNSTAFLEKQVAERTELLEEKTRLLRQLALELTEVEQRERRRLAQALHDHLQQYLVASKMRLDLIERRAMVNDKNGLIEARSYIDKAIDASRQLIAELKGGLDLSSIRKRVEALGDEFKATPVTDGIVVLVADDHLIVRQSLASLLMSQSFIKEVIEAGNGEEAIRQAEISDPDIILMDVNMPVMNGIKATQILCGRNSRAKVIGLSVQADAQMAQTMKDAGAVVYFNKSDETCILIETIKKFAFPPFSPN